MVAVLEKIIKLLQENNVEFELTEHEPVFTSEEAAKVRGINQKLGTKAMIVRTKAENYIFAIPADKMIDMKKVKKLFLVRDASLLSREDAERLTGLKMGCVPPLGLLFGLQTFVDDGVLGNEEIYFSPGSHTHTIKMKSADLVKITKPEIIQITK